MLAWLVIGTVACTVICYLIARSRSADTLFWAVMGFLLGPIAIPFAFFSKPLGPTPGARRDAGSP
jgi:hypothetical protein